MVALAGRRIDAADQAQQRFPLENVPVVRERIRTMLIENEAVGLVSSAACGADLLALDVAGEMALRRILVFPFDRHRFRETSVTDRPGGKDLWGPMFERVLKEVAGGDMITLGGHGESTAAYAAANERILDAAQELARTTGHAVVAAIVWDGIVRPNGDLTEGFRAAAEARGIPVVPIPTSSGATLLPPTE